MRVPERTKKAIEEVWEAIRASCRTDREACARVAQAINSEKKTRRRLSVKVVSTYALALGLRKPFPDRKRKRSATRATPKPRKRRAANNTPSLLDDPATLQEYRDLAKLADQIRALRPPVLKLLREELDRAV